MKAKEAEARKKLDDEKKARGDVCVYVFLVVYCRVSHGHAH